MRRFLAFFAFLLCACVPTVPAPVPLELTVAEDGAFSVRRGQEGTGPLRASVSVSGVRVRLDGAPTHNTSESDDALGHAEETRLELDTATAHLTLVLRKYVGFVTARVTASCPGSCAGARVEDFTLEGLALTDAGQPLAALSNGYSSWAPTYDVAVQRSAEPDVDAALTGNNQNALSSDARVSWWVSSLRFADAAVVSGALTAETWKTRVLTWRGAEGVQLRVVSGGGGDSLPLTAQGVSSETLFFTVSASATHGLTTWAQGVATLTPPPEAPWIPVGWNSWNTLFENVTQANALANAEALLALTPDANNVQLDDGWEQAWGTWTANAKFPDGMSGFATQAQTRGLHAGLWMAPFFVDETTPVALAHPDWFVNDAQGRPIAQRDFFTGRTYRPLDASNPDARAWLVGQVKAQLDLGYRYLKLDFLYAGAYEGRRQRDVTSLQAYRLAMKEIIAEAQAVGAYVVACGAPVLPSAGVAHALRTGNDIAARGTPYTFEWVKNVSRNVAARAFVTPFLANDPDTVLVRGLPDGVKRLQVTTALLAGRLLGYGDDLTTLTAPETSFLEKVATLPSMARLAESGPGFVPLDAPEPRRSSLGQAEALVDAESYAVPTTWVARGTSEGTLVGVFNWSSTEQTFSLEAGRLGLAGKETAEELWTVAPVSFDGHAWSVTVPARDAAYLRLR